MSRATGKRTGVLTTSELLVAAWRVPELVFADLSLIAIQFGQFVTDLRSGRDEQGMNALAAAARKLGRFKLLSDQLTSMAQVSSSGEASTFQRDLQAAIEKIEEALERKDLEVVCGVVENELLPVLTRWPSVTAELQAGLSAQAQQ